MLAFCPMISVNDRVIINLYNSNSEDIHSIIYDSERMYPSFVDSGSMPDSASAYGELAQLCRSFGQRTSCLMSLSYTLHEVF